MDVSKSTNKRVVRRMFQGRGNPKWGEGKQLNREQAREWQGSQPMVDNGLAPSPLSFWYHSQDFFNHH